MSEWNFQVQPRIKPLIYFSWGSLRRLAGWTFNVPKMTADVNKSFKTHSHQARLRPSTSVYVRRATRVDGRRRASTSVDGRRRASTDVNARLRPSTRLIWPRLPLGMNRLWRSLFSFYYIYRSCCQNNWSQQS